MIQAFRRNIIFVLTCVVAIGGYGFFVFAAPPGPGGYNPGETLDPECTPGQLVPEPCIVKLPSGGSVTADNGLTVTGSNVQLGGTLSQNTNIGLSTYNLGINTPSPDHQFQVTGTLKNEFTDSTSGLVSTLANSGDPLGIGIPGIALAGFDPATNLTAFTMNTIDGSSMMNLVGVGDISTFNNVSMMENTMDGISGTSNMYLGSGSSDGSGRIHIHRNPSSGSSTIRLQNANFVSGLISSIENDADLGVKFDFGGVDGFYTFPRADGSSSQVLTTDGSGQLSWTNSSSGITAIGAIDGLPRVTDGAQISGSTLYLQSAAPTYFGLVYGNTDTVNTMLGYNVTTGTTNLNQTAGVGDSNVHSNTIIGNSAAMNSNGIDGSDFFGAVAGLSASNVQFGTFIGQGAGFQSSLIYASYFNGYFAGQQSENIQHSVYMGTYAGRQSENVDYSVFIGDRAGMLAIAGAENSVFIGKSAGHSDLVNNSSTNIAGGCASGINNTCYSILIGPASSTNGFSNSIALGAYATNTATNQFMIGSTTRPINNTIITGTGSFKLPIGTDGQRTGSPASGMIRFSSTNDCYEGYKTSGSAWSCFSTGSAGWSLTGNSGTTAGTNFIGTTDAEDFVIKVNGNERARFYESTGSSNRSVSFGGGIATASDMFVYGNDAGLGSIGSDGSIFMGIYAGKNSNGANNSFFIGSAAGENSSSISSIFFGQQAGKDTALQASNFIGLQAGQSATNASNSNFIGRYAGENATDASESNFFGYYAGYAATDASESIFIGHYTGTNSLNASKSVFIGRQSGYNAASAANSIFLGDNAGNNDASDNTTDPDDFSILIGNNTSTGGFENSIALGSYATNTASNQFMIGSTTRPIDTTRINGSASTQCTITTGTGIACTSDERVKTNIADLSSDTLIKLSNVKTVSYNWLQNPTSKTQIGFLAQDLEQYFPELVETDSMGMKSVYYAQMTPILVEAIREMNLNVTQIADMTRENTWRDSLIAWFGNAANGITEMIAGTLRAKDQLCVGETCLNEVQVQQILQVIQSSPQNNIIQNNPGSDDSNNNSVDQNTTNETQTDDEVVPSNETTSNEPSVSQDNSDTGDSDPVVTE